MKYRIPIYIFSLLTLLNSCITKFTPEIEEYDNLIVVEGVLTNEDRSNYIKISRTIPVGITGLSSPLVQAHVYVKDDLNNVGIFTETRPGVYRSDSLTFRGETGRTYTLTITINGKKYESTPMLMEAVPAIDSLYYEFDYYNDRANYPPLYSYDIYFDSFDPDNSTSYYRWTYDEVWEYHLPWHYPPPHKSICWLANKSTEILIKNNSTLEQSIIEKQPLIQLDNKSTNKLHQKYSIMLKQYSISENEYLYWDSMKKLTDEQGGLYDPVPKPLIGNIRSVEDPAEPVLGYFSVSGVTEKRLFIQNDTIKYLAGGAYCVTDTIATIEEISGHNSYVFILEEIDGVGFLVSTFEQCADCRLSGTNVPPPFWYDEK